MTLTDADRTQIARVLATSLPTWEHRAAVAAASDLRDVQLAGTADVAWRLLVDAAIDQDQLGALLRVASRRAPDDAAIAGLVEGVARGVLPKPPMRGTGLCTHPIGSALVVVAIGALGVVLAAQGLPSLPLATHVASIEPTENATPSAVVAQTEAEAPPEADAPAEAEAPSDVVASAEPVAPPEAAAPDDASVSAPPASLPSAAGSASVAPPAPVETPAAPSAAAPSPSGAGCVGVEGWAWMGETSTLHAGDTWVIDGGVNVRADRPTAENHWQWKHPVVCWLTSGTRLRLPEDPVAVPGGATWVRVRGVDVVR